jgi:hypothetical protein
MGENLGGMKATEPVPTSTRLRAAAILALDEFKRPITAHEVEKWVQDHDPAMGNELSGKCYDYVRIILSLTDDGTIIKYKSQVGIPGVDPRAAFYGLTNGSYDVKQWVPVNGAVRKKRHSNRGTTSDENSPPNVVDQETSQSGPVFVSQAAVDEESSQSGRVFVSQDVGAQKDELSGSPSDQAWFGLTTLIPAKDPFWTAFMTAIDSIKSRIEVGSSPEIVVKEIMEENPGFNRANVSGYVTQILGREATLKKRLMVFASGADDL